MTPSTIARQRAEAVATLVNCPAEPTSEALACMRDKTAEAITLTDAKFQVIQLV
jgi:Carboxylesterase.